MPYVLTPLKRNSSVCGNSIIYIADDLVFFDGKTASEKQNIQFRWEARKLRRRLTKHTPNRDSQPSKKL